LAPGEHIYGLGESFTRLDKLGQTHDGWLIDSFGTGTGEVYKHIPFLLSTRGYGVFFNTTHRLHAYVGSQSLMAYTIVIDDPRLDLFLIYGPGLKQVLARYVEITGAPALPPKGSFGIWTMPLLSDGKDVNSYLALFEKFREMDIPVDLLLAPVFLLSNRDHSTDEELLAFTHRLSEELAKIHIKTAFYTSPMLMKGSPMEQEARAHHYALAQRDGSPYEVPLAVTRPERFPGQDLSCTLEAVTRSDEWRDKVLKASRGPCLLIDFTNPEAVTWWKSKIAARMKAGCYGIGMSDFGEDIPVDAIYHNGRSGLEMHNAYSLLYQKACYEGVAESSGHRGLINARSGTAGIQRFPICWSGDPNCTWQDMANTLRAGLSIGLSGVPFWSCDNAGFNDVHGQLTPELWIRWSQWSLFLSQVRLNGMGPVRAPWSFGELAVENFRKYAKLRYRLLPYIYSHAFNATRTGLPLIRAMVLDFQHDTNTHTMEDQYMFGDSLLVAPVCTPVNQRTVYLPKGTWYEYETGKELTGPALLHIEPPLEQLPLYVKADSIIPMGPDLAHVSEKRFDPITLDIRLSSQAAFTLYDDDEGVGTEEIVTCLVTKQRGQIRLRLGASQKAYITKFNGTEVPSGVSLNGVDLPRLESSNALEASQTGWHFDTSQTVYVKFKASGSESQLVLVYS
jgi:alpha-D-xyloside xylohydrolase